MNQNNVNFDQSVVRFYQDLVKIESNGINFDQSGVKFYQNGVRILKHIHDFILGKIIFDPGRSIIGNTGILISKIIYIKKNKNKNFVILDAAMNDFMRPALYGTKHQIIPSIKNKKEENKIFEFVGPICESTDKFLSTNKFQTLKEGDVIIICDVGAYGISLASNYNVRPLPMEILIKNSKKHIIKNRQKLSDII